jgi:hypothetical protein
METGHDSETAPGLMRLQHVLTGDCEVEGAFHEEGNERPSSKWTWALQREPPD